VTNSEYGNAHCPRIIPHSFSGVFSSLKVFLGATLQPGLLLGAINTPILEDFKFVGHVRPLPSCYTFGLEVSRVW